jgi:hypothetical protein
MQHTGHENKKGWTDLPMSVRLKLEAWADHLHSLSSVNNFQVLKRMAPSALRGLFLQRGRSRIATMRASHDAYFDFNYPKDNQRMEALYEKAKRMQWNGSLDLKWDTSVDPFNPELPILGSSFVEWKAFEASGIHMNSKEQSRFLWSICSWMLSQFLHGEQGALMAAAQITEATPIFDGKFYGATQVMDEARHVEVFNRYLETKMERRYDINDNLFTIIDGLMTDNRWDMKFLGMQILVEGLALGAFSTLHRMTEEPLMKEMLRRVIQDEARHVNFGLLALRPVYTQQLSEKERREREDWAFEVVVLMKNRFLAHEIYEEDYAHLMTRRSWNQLVDKMPGMALFRKTMFKRLVPNLRAIGLLTPRIYPQYEKIGLAEFIHLNPSDGLSEQELLVA